MRLENIAFRVYRRARVALQPRPHAWHEVQRVVRGKRGVEIGGPSIVFRKVLPIYDVVGSLDNCDFSSSTVWARHDDKYQFSNKRPPGKNFVLDATNLAGIPDNAYDFLLSSHNIEHIANPLKALREWQRVAKTLVLIAPDYRGTFDWKRTPTPVEHMVQDFEREIGEDDLTHLDEILKLHDLSKDPGAGSFDEFKKRSQNNIQNRCLHHHVFDERNLADLLRAAGATVHVVERVFPMHLCALASFLPVKRSG